MQTLTHLKQALDYLESHLDQELDYGEIAQKALCSQYHFQRMFAFLTGVPLSEYIRRRRLTLAAFDLQNSSERVLDIALKYGYQSPDAFTRAFQQLHGLTPKEARKPGAQLKAYPAISFTLSIKGVSEMHYRIVEKPALMVAGLKKRLSQLTLSQEVGEMWSSVDYDQLQTALSQLPAGAPSGMLGVYDGMYEDDTTDYYIGAFVQAGESDSLQLLSIPPATWAVFELKGPMPTALAQGWERIYTEWFPTSGYEHAAGPEIEWYSAGDMSRDDYVSEIWIPVVKAGSLSPEQTVPLPAWVRPESSR